MKAADERMRQADVRVRGYREHMCVSDEKSRAFRTPATCSPHRRSGPRLVMSGSFISRGGRLAGKLLSGDWGRDSSKARDEMRSTDGTEYSVLVEYLYRVQRTYTEY